MSTSFQRLKVVIFLKWQGAKSQLDTSRALEIFSTFFFYLEFKVVCWEEERKRKPMDSKLTKKRTQKNSKKILYENTESIKSILKCQISLFAEASQQLEAVAPCQAVN